MASQFSGEFGDVRYRITTPRNISHDGLRIRGTGPNVLTIAHVLHFLLCRLMMDSYGVIEAATGDDNLFDLLLVEVLQNMPLIDGNLMIKDEGRTNELHGCVRRL